MGQFLHLQHGSCWNPWLYKVLPVPKAHELGLLRVQVFGPETPSRSPKDSELRSSPNTQPCPPHLEPEEGRKEREVQRAQNSSVGKEDLGQVSGPLRSKGLWD